MPFEDGMRSLPERTRTWRDFDILLSHIKSDNLRDITLKWRAFGGDVRIPAWRDIDPIELKKYLPILWSWKYDVYSKSFTGRLAGQDIVRAHGKSLRGYLLTEFFVGDSARIVQNRYEKIVSETMIMHGIGRVFKSFEGYGIGERLVFPLSEDGVNCDGVLGATTYSLGVRHGKIDISTIQMNDEEVNFYQI